MNIEVRIKPGSKKGPLIEVASTGKLTVYVSAPAVDGQANSAVIKLLADYYKVAKSRITIVRGQTARIKIINVATSE
jgi:uncharacterized protein (TIGR00251 family)